MPNAYEMEELHAFKGAEGDQTVEIHAERRRARSRRWSSRRTSEPHVGDVIVLPHLLRHASPTARRCTTPRATAPRSSNHLSIAQGKERIEVPRLHAGDIGCVAKLRNTHTNDTLSTQRASGAAAADRVPGAARQHARCTRTIAPTRRSCSRGCTGCTTRIRRSRRTTTPRRTRRSSPAWASGTSRSRMAKLKRKFGVTAELDAAEDRLSRDDHGARPKGRGGTRSRSGGRGQFGDCWVRIRAAAARHRLRVRRRDRRRLDPAQVHSRGRQGDPGGRGARRARRLSRWWTSRSSCSTARITRSTRTKCRSRWPAFRRSRPSRRSASRCCSSRSTRSRSSRPTSTSAT